MNKGFSLIEVVIVVAIAASVVIVVSNFGNNISGLNSLVGSELQSKAGTSAALSMIIKDLQSASFSANGGYPINVATSTEIGFFSDIDKTGVMKHVRYFYASSSIYRGITDPTGTPAFYPTSSETVTDFIDNVTPQSSTLFRYYNSSYPQTSSTLAYPIDLSAIRLIGITFSVQLNVTSTNRSPIQYFNSLINLRNLYSN